MKLNGDTKLAIASVVLLGLGAWYLKRQVSNAAGAAWDGFTSGIGGAWDSVASGISSGGNAVVNALGVQATKDPITGQMVPYGAVPNAAPGTPYNVPWYLGGGSSDAFSPTGTYNSSLVRQAEQADVRRIDNNLDSTPYGAVPSNYTSAVPWYLGG